MLVSSTGIVRIADADFSQVVEAPEPRSQACDVVRIGFGEQHGSGVALGESLALIDDRAEQCLAVPLHHERHPDPSHLARLILATGEAASQAHPSQPRAGEHARGVEQAIPREAIVYAGDGDGRASPERCLGRVVGRNEHDAPRQLAQVAHPLEHRGIHDENGGLIADALRKQLVGSPPPRRVRFIGDRARTVVDDALGRCDHAPTKRTKHAEAQLLGTR